MSARNAKASTSPAVVLSAEEASVLSDRVYEVRCAAEDMATALEEGAGVAELRELCDAVMRAARAADGWVRVRLDPAEGQEVEVGSSVALTVAGSADDQTSAASAETSQTRAASEQGPSPDALDTEQNAAVSADASPGAEQSLPVEG